MQASLQRKVIYGITLIFLLVLLWIIGRPAHVVVQAGGEIQLEPGGFLAQYRTSEGLTEFQMGELDPAGSAAKLATFGMRGVAIAMLWHQANERQKRHEWNDVAAIGNQITFLEPHFVTIWDFLGWTLAYNASAGFDDYRERYRWVIRGTDFLVTGLNRNQNAPRLHRSVGWTVSQRIGIADEQEQFRRLLREDEDFGYRHNAPLPSERDNWLLGRRWYRMGEALVSRGVSIGNISDPVYFGNSRLNLFNYAKWKRRDGIFGEEAIAAWHWALDEWVEFGQMTLNTAIPVDRTLMSVPHGGTEVHTVRMEDTDIIQEEARQLLKELHAIAPDLKRTLVIERWHQLGDVNGQQGSLISMLEEAYELDPRWNPTEELQAVRQWLDENEPDWRIRLTADRNTLIPADQAELRRIPLMFLDEDDQAMLTQTDTGILEVQGRALGLLRMNPRLISQEIQELEDVSRELMGRARAIVDELDTHRERTRMSDLFRGILNYDARFREVAVETTQQADDAQRYRHEARIAFHAGRTGEALEGWLAGMRKWDELLDIEEFQDRISDPDFVRDRVDLAERILIIFDVENKIFSDVADDPVPLHRIMWSRMFITDDPIARGVEALEYAKEYFENATAETDIIRRRESLERAEGYFLTVARHFQEINFRERFMQYAPFFEFRDRILETIAYYIRSLEAQGRPLPEPMILRQYVELMLLHDPAVEAANVMMVDALPLVRDGNFEEAQQLLDQAVLAWQAILRKYPIIAHDSTIPAYADVVRLALLYAEVMQSQDMPIPDDFSLRTFLR